MIKYIIWDFDGVICNSKDIAFKVHNDLRKKYKKLPKVNNSMDYSKLMDDGYDKSLERYLSKEQKDNYLFEHREKMYGKRHKLKVFSKVMEFIKDKKIPSIIITATYEKLVNEVLYNNGYNKDIFLEILGRETKGGKIEKLNYICEKFNLNKNEIIYIGDTLNDVNFCNKAGINIVCVGYGYSTKEIFIDKNILNFCKDQDELIEYLKNITKNEMEIK